MSMNQNIYALYQGENNLTDGTIREIAKNQGMKIESVRFLGHKTWWHKVVTLEQFRKDVGLDEK